MSDDLNSANLGSSDTLLNAVRFRGHARNLLRAISLRKVLHNGAAVFSSSSSASGSSCQSETVPRKVRIDYFISHNWSVSRFDKFTTLCFYFNSSRAVVVVSLFALLWFFLTLKEVLPLRHIMDSTHGELKMGVFSQLLTLPIFIFTLATRIPLNHGTRRSVKSRSRQRSELCSASSKSDLQSVQAGEVRDVRHNTMLCFVDSACIHPGTKQTSIQNFNAFLHHSNVMLALYSDVYLDRLWTVYEFACFSLIHSSCCIDVLRTGFSRWYLMMLIFGYFMTCCWHLDHVLSISKDSLVYGTYLIWSLAFAQLSRREQQELACTLRRFREFDIRHATCSDETDRPFLAANISSIVAAFMDFHNYSQADEKASNLFNELLRKRVLTYMTFYLGSVPVSFSYIVTYCWVLDLPANLDKACGLILKYGAEDIRSWGCIVLALSFSCSHYPFVVEAIHIFMSKGGDLVGWQEFVWVIVGTLLAAASGGIFYALNRFLLSKASDFNLFSFLFVLYNFLCNGLSVFVLCKRHKAYKDVCSELDEKHGFGISRGASQSSSCFAVRSPDQKRNAVNVVLAETPNKCQEAVIQAPTLQQASVHLGGADEKPVSASNVQVAQNDIIIVAFEESEQLASSCRQGDQSYMGEIDHMDADLGGNRPNLNDMLNSKLSL